jgi:hypothetical protein
VFVGLRLVNAYRRIVEENWKVLASLFPVG